MAGRATAASQAAGWATGGADPEASVTVWGAEAAPGRGLGLQSRAGTHPWGAASLPVWFVPRTFQNETETGRGALSFHKVTEGTGIFLVEHVKSP